MAGLSGLHRVVGPLLHLLYGRRCPRPASWTNEQLEGEASMDEGMEKNDEVGAISAYSNWRVLWGGKPVNNVTVQQQGRSRHRSKQSTQVLSRFSPSNSTALHKTDFWQHALSCSAVSLSHRNEHILKTWFCLFV